MLTNLKYYLVGAVLVLGPVGLRVLTWERPPVHQESVADVNAGKNLFTHEWRVNDRLCPGGDGLGPVFNAKSCVACHNQGGAGGGGDNRHNVTTYVLERANGKIKAGVVHASASRSEYRETLNRLDVNLPCTSRPTLALVRRSPRRMVGKDVLHLSQRNTPALFGSKLIDEIADRVIVAEERKQQLRWGLRNSNTEAVPVGRAFRLPDGRIGKFGWKAQSASLGDFVQAACANELGLGNPNQAQPVPMVFASYRTPGTDLTQKQCNQITAFCASLPRPVELRHANAAIRAKTDAGKKLFHKIGCAHCHTPNMGSVEGIYSDLLMHRMGRELVGGGSYNDPVLPLPPDEPSPGDGSGPFADEWRTPPLWGVADSAPYLHDGRAPTLHEAIMGHGGQGAAAKVKYAQFSPEERQQLLNFLQSLHAPGTEQVAQR